MKYWQMIASMALPVLHLAGLAKENEDENTTGNDDLIGMLLVFISDLLSAVLAGKALPKVPAQIQSAIDAGTKIK